MLCMAAARTTPWGASKLPPQCHEPHHCRTRRKGIRHSRFLCSSSFMSLLLFQHCFHITPQWRAADAGIKIPSGENTEVKHSPFKAWSRSVYSHACYAYCQGCLPCSFLPFRSIHLHFFQNLSHFFLCWLWLTHGSCVGLQNKIGHPARCRFPC